MSELIELIKVLRERTGAGLMDCKSALLANDSDIEKSITWLREKGITKNAKKAGRIAAEGLTSLKIEGNKAVLAEINCETDFVAHSDPFIALLKEVTDIAFEKEPKDVEELNGMVGKSGHDVAFLFNDAGIKLGEKLSLRRVLVVKKADNELFGSYVHMGGAITVLAIADGGDQETADNIAMCIASNNPSYASINEVSKEEIEKEKAVQAEAAKEDPSFAKKPANIQDKILEGRVMKHFETQVLDYGEYVVDPSKTVGQVMKEHKMSIKSFIKWQVGEGIEKKHEDLAAEVAAQLGENK